jgi:hypothetical protein
LRTDIGALDTRLAALDEPIRRWNDARERAFSAKFQPKEGKLSTLMSRLPPAAAAAAGVGPGPQEQVFALLDEICDEYARSDAPRCALIRGLVQQHEARRLLESYIGHASRVLEQGKRAEWLTRALAAASIEDQRRDYRDWLMSVGDAYLAGRTAGLDPAPVLARIGAISNTEGHRAAPTPTSAALGQFEKSAYFATSILPRMR